LLFLVFSIVAPCRASSIVFVTPPNASEDEGRKLALAARFYGLDLKVHFETSQPDHSDLLRALSDNETLAVVISANVLPSLDRNEVLLTLRHKMRAAPILVVGIEKDTRSEILKEWSGGAITATRLCPKSASKRYSFAPLKEITGSLSSESIPFGDEDALYFETTDAGDLQTVVSIREGNEQFPVLVKDSLNNEEIFFESAISPSKWSPTKSPDVVATFSRIAPELIFVRHAAGPYAWHATTHYANFTIDDAWLRSHYGHLDYAGLLKEMQRHDFHTTIAFIPWNFDRSEPNVVTLFRIHPNRFSICVHGNNHDHKEFTDYVLKPLADQVANIKQALARMNQFTALTQIPYDPVMVFPHSIAPAQTLVELKKYNFWATVNSQDIPEGSVAPEDPLFALRPVTLAFGNFASMKRESVEVAVPQEAIVVNAFLDNPLMFFGHEGFFTQGIDAFDHVADLVNKIQPDTKWTGLGPVVEHLYLTKLRDDSSLDILAFSPQMCLENPSSGEVIFHVRKDENGSPPIRSVTADGRPLLYDASRGSLTFTVFVPAKQTKIISVQYQNDLDIAKIDVSKRSLRVSVLRRVSDFRDDTLSEIWLGRIIIGLYNALGPSLRLVVGITLALLCLLACLCLYRRLMTRRV
jgi:hypothetical protein